VFVGKEFGASGGEKWPVVLVRLGCRCEGVLV
jgi:hypothetical protein